MFLSSKMESLNLQVVTVLMSLEIKHQTIPHLIALTSSIEHTNVQVQAVFLNSAKLS